MSKSNEPKPPNGNLVKKRDYGPRAAAAPFELSQEPVTPQGPAKPRPPGAVPAPAFEHLGELPATYGSYSLYLVAYDPHQLFAYWDIDWSAAAGKQFVLQVKRADGSVESRLTLAPREVSRYIGVSVPGGIYSVELTARDRDGQWKELATSGPVTLPPEGIAKETEPTFATLPFHLSFQRLIDLLKTVMRPREELAAAMARLQRGANIGAATIFEAIGGLGEEQMQTLDLLLKGSAREFLPATDGASGGNFGASDGLASANLSSVGRWAGPALSSEMLSSRGRPLGPLIMAAGLGGGSSELAQRAFGPAPELGSGGLSSAAAARGSEILSSAAGRAANFGLSSEAWRRAAASAPVDSSSSQSSAAFVRAVQTNLEALGSLFSSTASSQLGSGGAPSSSSRGRW